MNLKQNIKKYAKKGVSSSRSFLKKQKDIKKDVVKNALANIYGTKGKQKRERISDKLKKLFDRKLRCPCCNKPFRHPEYHHLDCNPNNSNNASNILKVCSDCHKDIHSEISKQIRPLVKRIKIAIFVFLGLFVQNTDFLGRNYFMGKAPLSKTFKCRVIKDLQ